MCWPAPAYAAQPVSHLPEKPSPDPCSWHQPGLSSDMCSMDVSAQPCPEGGTVFQLCRTSFFQTHFPSVFHLEGLHLQSSLEFSPNCFPSHPPLLVCFVQEGPALPPASFPSCILPTQMCCCGCRLQSALLQWWVFTCGCVPSPAPGASLSPSRLGPGFSQVQWSMCCSRGDLVMLSQSPGLDAACLTSTWSWQVSWGGQGGAG